MKYVLVVSMLSLVLGKQIAMMINLPYHGYDRAVCYNYHCWACRFSIKVKAICVVILKETFFREYSLGSYLQITKIVVTV